MAGRRVVGSVVVVVALVLAACGGGSDDEGGGADDDGGSTGEVLASLLVIEPEVTVEDDGDERTVDGTTEVGPGAKVRTDAGGFAEVGFALGSLLRLDVDTSVELLDLVDAGGTVEVRARVESGRTWSRAGDLGDGGSYIVETPVAVAETTDGAFVTQCDDIRCSFSVLKGTLDVELEDGTAVTVEAPASVEVRDGTISEPVLVPFDGAFGDPWLADNNDRDVEAGLDDVVAAYAELDPTLASLTGTFTGTRTVTEVTCDPACGVDETPRVGDVADRAYTFDIDCSKGTPCTGTVDTEYVVNNEVVSGVQPLTFDGTTYSWAVQQPIPGCDDGTGEIDLTIEWTLTPVAAEVREGAFVVTAIEGEAAATNVVIAPGSCTGDRRSSSNTGSISVTR